MPAKVHRLPDVIDSGLLVAIPTNIGDKTESRVRFRRQRMITTHRPGSAALAMAHIPTPCSVGDLLASAGLGEDDIQWRLVVHQKERVALSGGSRMVDRCALLS